MKISEATQVAIDRAIILQKMKGNDTFKDIWLGNGWLSKDKDGKIIFTPTKQLPYQEDKMKTKQEKEKFAQALDKVSSMRVDDFQTSCEDNKIKCSELDDMVYYLAIALMEKENV